MKLKRIFRCLGRGDCEKIIDHRQITYVSTYIDCRMVPGLKNNGEKYAKRGSARDNAMTTLICKIPPNLPLLKGGITPL